MDLLPKHCHEEILAKMYFILHACALQKHPYTPLGALRDKWQGFTLNLSSETSPALVLLSEVLWVHSAGNYCNQTPVPKEGCMIQLCRTAFGGGDFPSRPCCPHYRHRNQDNSTLLSKNRCLALSPSLPSLNFLTEQY